MVLHLELGSDPPIGSDRGSVRDTNGAKRVKESIARTFG